MEKATKEIVDGILALFVLGAAIATEALVLRYGLPSGIDGVVAGRILGTMDALALIVANYRWGNTRASMQQVDAITAIGQAAANTPIHIVTANGSPVRTTSPAQEVIANATNTVAAQADITEHSHT
jgi:hypothetical protein